MRFITIILSLFLFSTLYANSKTYVLCSDTVKIARKKRNTHLNVSRLKHVTPRDKEYYNDCVFTHKYTIGQRLKRYPFYKAAKILVVSYDGAAEPNIEITTNGDTLDAMTHKSYGEHKPHGLHFKDDTLSYVSLFEIKPLTLKQINQLTNIIYNTDYRIPNDYAHPGRSCFNPRNALIFYNKDGKVFDYFEICFECEVADSKSHKITLGSGCNQKFELLRQYLISLGIKYGTINKD